MNISLKVKPINRDNIQDMLHFYLFNMEYVTKSWYFTMELEVREGAPGWADDDTYQSKNFDSFEDCYRKYIQFSPAKYWRHLRSVCNEYIVYQCGDVTTKNRAIFGMVYYRANHIVQDLGITKEEFNVLIDKLENMV